MTTAKSSPAILVCPGCGAYGTPELFSADPDARTVSAMLARLPADLAPVLLSYLRLFAPRKHALTWRRCRTLIDELLPLIEAQQIRRKGREWPAPASAWISAIQAMLENRSLELPMTSHGYLLSIIAGEADKAEGVHERAAERARPGVPDAPAVADDPAIVAGQVRTAVTLLRTEQQARKRFQEVLTEPAAAELLRKREFSAAVIAEALQRYFRGRA